MDDKARLVEYAITAMQSSDRNPFSGIDHDVSSLLSFVLVAPGVYQHTDVHATVSRRSGWRTSLSQFFNRKDR